ncbi:MAG: hypothetical protein PHN82_01815 [bacterium]|nr:hypothetical protein [bacterium]
MKKILPLLCAVLWAAAARGAEQGVPVVVGSWNIELFDAAGPADKTPPTRSLRHLRMIAETILGTGADVMGLQEIIAPPSRKEEYSLAQLVSMLNALEGERRGGLAQIWKGAAFRPEGGGSHVALVWRDDALEMVGKAVALTSLGRRFGDRSRPSPRDAVLFQRVPLAARFAVRNAPGHDFTVVVLRMRGEAAGVRGALDTDGRRRGEWEGLIRDWLLRPERQGSIRNERMIVLGDMDEEAPVIVEHLDEHGTADDVRGRLILDPSDFSRSEALLLFTSGAMESPRDFSFQANAEAGERHGRGVRQADVLSPYRKLVDHILISRGLLDRWDGEFRIEYFEQLYPLEDHIRISDHRPVSIRLLFPGGAGAGRRGS